MQTEEIAVEREEGSGLAVKIGSLVFVRRRKHDGNSQGHTGS